MSSLLCRIVAVAGITGMVTGVLLTGIQLWLVLPKIEAAEEYERQATISNAQLLATPVSKDNHASSGAALTTSHFDDHQHHNNERLNSRMRIFWTMVANIGTSFGFALLLVAIFCLRGRGDWSQGLLLGSVGFVVFFLNPSLGVPPQIPGGQTVGLVNHQLWWLSTVVLSLIAAAGLSMSKKLWIKAVGVLLLVLPHLFGSPQREVYSGAAPEALMQDFVTAITITNGVFWLMLGLFSAFIYQHQMRSQLKDKPVC